MLRSNLNARVTSLLRVFRPTPCVRVHTESIELYGKLEYFNLSGSVKDRAAYGILSAAIRSGEIQPGTTIVESSSGNLASSLATMCRLLDLRFVPVIDLNTPKLYEAFLRNTCDTVIKVDEPDVTGGYLQSRLHKVAQLRRELSPSFWTNQYGNVAAADGHAALLAKEITDEFARLDYAFIGVSSGGTIAGLSRVLKQVYPGIKIIAVDAVGSAIFQSPPRRRRVSGLGSSIVPELVRSAMIDEVVYATDRDAVEGCHELLQEHHLFVGGSTGMVFRAIQRYLARGQVRRGMRAIFLCCDRGSAYLDTIFDPGWCRNVHQQDSKLEPPPSSSASPVLFSE